MSSVLHPEDEHFRRQSRMSVEGGAPKGLFRSKKEKKASAKARAKAEKRRAKTGGEGSSIPVPAGDAVDPRHTNKRVAWPRYAYYDVAFQFFTEHVLNAEFVSLPEPTRKTIEVGASNSSDFVCAPFKHIMGDYIEALRAGADVIAQFTGPCRLGYYGELQESILRDMGFDFEMLNFSEAAGHGIKAYVDICKKKVNPKMSVPLAVKNMLATLKMVEHLDAYDDYYLANAGFEVERGAFDRDRAQFFDDMRACTCGADVEQAFRAGMARVRAIPLDKPERPIRIGLVGEYFTAVDAPSNLYLEKKLFAMHVELARSLGITNRNIHYNEPNLRRAIPEYARFDMGPTSTMTIEAAKRYAEEGFDGIVHMKSTGCTPEIDTMPVLQRLSRDLHIPILFLSYDSQTSDAGLDTRLEAFYDMVAMRKAR